MQLALAQIYGKQNFKKIHMLRITTYALQLIRHCIAIDTTYYV